MDMQEYLDNAIKSARAETLATSAQLTLGEIILKIEPLLKKQKEVKENFGHEAKVVFDFEYLFPTGIDSWRGSYSELALEFSSEGEAMEISKFYKMLKETIGKEFTGYKGGEFTMNKHTPVWVANYSHSGNTGVVDIVDNDFEIIIITAWCEY